MNDSECKEEAESKSNDYSHICTYVRTHTQNLTNPPSWLGQDLPASQALPQPQDPFPGSKGDSHLWETPNAFQHIKGPGSPSGPKPVQRGLKGTSYM